MSYDTNNFQQVLNFVFLSIYTFPWLFYFCPTSFWHQNQNIFSSKSIIHFSPYFTYKQSTPPLDSLALFLCQPLPVHLVQCQQFNRSKIISHYTNALLLMFQWHPTAYVKNYKFSIDLLKFLPFSLSLVLEIYHPILLDLTYPTTKWTASISLDIFWASSALTNDMCPLMILSLISKSHSSFKAQTKSCEI